MHEYLYMTSQVQDYTLLGSTFADFNFLDFTVETYEIQKKNENDDDGEHTNPHVGQRRNLRACYLPNHPKFNSHVRVQ
jgi:hypothetical protein